MYLINENNTLRTLIITGELNNEIVDRKGGL